MFELSKHNCKIAHLNIRTEAHGEENVLAADVKVEADMTNDFLSYLAPGLKASLYEKPETGQLELICDDHYLPHIRYPELTELRWDRKMEKAVFIIHRIENGDLCFDAMVDKLCLQCKEGGTVSISFRAAVLPTPEQSGQLAAILGTDARVSVREADDDDDPARGDMADGPLFAQRRIEEPA
jgi:hypothetical protein